MILFIFFYLFCYRCRCAVGAPWWTADRAEIGIARPQICVRAPGTLRFTGHCWNVPWARLNCESIAARELHQSCMRKCQPQWCFESDTITTDGASTLIYIILAQIIIPKVSRYFEQMAGVKQIWSGQERLVLVPFWRFCTGCSGAPHSALWHDMNCAVIQCDMIEWNRIEQNRMLYNMI